MIFMIFTVFTIGCQLVTPVVKFVMIHVLHKRDRELRLKAQIEEMKEQLRKLPVNEKSIKYTKMKKELEYLQVRYNRAESANNSTFRYLDKTMSHVVGDLFCNMVCVTIIINEPENTLYINPNWVYPLNSLLVWPHRNNHIGLLFWFLLIKSSMRTLKGAF